MNYIYDDYLNNKLLNDGYFLVNDDCLKSNNYIIENTIDLFFVDPPYFITDILWDKQWSNKDDYYDWCSKWIKLMFLQLKINGSAYICSQWQHSGALQSILEKTGFNILNRITWKRDKGRGSKKNWKSIHEDIWFVSKSNNYIFNIDSIKIKKKVIAPYKDENGNPKDWFIDDNGDKVRFTHPGNLWDEFCVPFWSSKEVRSYAKTKRSPNNTLKKHNTQKPKDLVKKCLLASSNEGDIIVDYFAGSGTTLIACKELNRNCILFEIDENYCNIIKTRLLEELKSNDKENITNDKSLDQFFKY